VITERILDVLIKPIWGAHLRIGAIIHRVTADLLWLQYKYVLRYAVDNNDFEGYPVICTDSQMRPSLGCWQIDGCVNGG